MIRLRRVPPPLELTPEIVTRLTDEFALDPTKEWAPRWAKKVLKRQLKKMGRKKCAYCEVKIGRNSEWAGCDHFKHKATYRSLVLAWKNLLPCCPRCNSQKGTLDTVITPIVNPRFLNPSESMYVQVILIEKQILTYVKGKHDQDKGINTEIELDLNAYEVVDARDEYVRGMVRELGLLARYLDDTNTIGISDERISILRDCFKAILDGITPNNHYAGTVASYLMTLPDFERIYQFLKENNAWSTEMQKKLVLAQKHKLDCVVLS